MEHRIDCFCLSLWNWHSGSFKLKATSVFIDCCSQLHAQLTSTHGWNQPSRGHKCQLVFTCSAVYMQTVILLFHLLAEMWYMYLSQTKKSKVEYLPAVHQGCRRVFLLDMSTLESKPHFGATSCHSSIFAVWRSLNGAKSKENVSDCDKSCNFLFPHPIVTASPNSLKAKLHPVSTFDLSVFRRFFEWDCSPAACIEWLLCP